LPQLSRNATAEMKEAGIPLDCDADWKIFFSFGLVIRCAPASACGSLMMLKVCD
jgi:hypothetical protein